MQAIHMTRVGGPEVLEVVDVPEPEVLPGCVRVRNRAIAVNFHDINMRRGDDPGTEVPVVPGTDFAGVVDAVGDGVDHVRVGDRVVGITMHGAYAESTMTLAPLVIPLPEAVSFEQAASCPVAGLTAYFMSHQLVRIEPGMAVAVYAAAGSVGCFMGAMLRELKAVSIGIVGSAEKAEIARRAGYVHVVNYRSEELVARVLALTNGEGAAVVFDSVAGPQFRRTIDLAAVDGMVVVFGRAAGPPPQEAIDYWLRCQKNLAVRTYFLGTTIQNRLPEVPAAYSHLFAGLASGAIHLPITTMPLRDAARAHARIEGQQTVGKVILVP